MRRVLIATLASAVLAASAAAPGLAQAPAAPQVPPPAATPPASVAEYQGASCLVGGVTAAAVTATVHHGLLSIATAAVAGCAIGWLGSPHLLTLWRKVQ